MEYGKEGEGEAGWKRQHTVSIPKKLYATLKEEAEARGLTVGELNRSIIRCWAEEKEAPPRFAKVAKVAPPVAVKPAPPSMPQQFSLEDALASQRAPEPVRIAEPPPATITRLPDPDFDSPESLQEAQRLLASRHNNEDVPF